MNLLWVGPGLGDALIFHWTDTFLYLIEEGRLKINKFKLIDIGGVPKPFFNESFCKRFGIKQETAKQDFFREIDNWDIIIVDFIEAWREILPTSQKEMRWWPDFMEIPYKEILNCWERKLLELQPFQVWVRQDGAKQSTIIPDLRPEYYLAVEVDRGFRQKHIDIYKNTQIWDMKAAKHFEGLHIWQKT